MLTVEGDIAAVGADRKQLRRAFADYVRTKDPAVREELVLAHLHLVHYLAARFAGRGEPLDDLLQAGSIGLLKAIDRFDPTRGVEFITYAIPTILGEIKRHFRDKSWALRVPRRLQELSVAIHRLSESLPATLGRAPTVDDIAGCLGATSEEIIEAHELGSAYAALSLDAERKPGGETTGLTLSDGLGELDANLARLEDRACLRAAFRVLDAQERTIMYLRFYEQLSQSDVARRLGISQMSVSRLQRRALEKLRATLRASGRPTSRENGAGVTAASG
jgi:RNA polymerase sigma-B factor